MISARVGSGNGGRSSQPARIRIADVTIIRMAEGLPGSRRPCHPLRLAAFGVSLGYVLRPREHADELVRAASKRPLGTQLVGRSAAPGPPRLFVAPSPAG